MKFVVALAPIFFVLFLYGGSGTLFKNQYDDAYITYRYAANFALGNGLVFNVGEKTNAASSLMFTLILSAFYKIGLTNLELLSVIINILSAIGICLIVYKSILLLTKNSYLAVFFSLLTGLHGFISGWAISGMETVFFTFLVSAFVYQYYFQKKVNKLLLTLTMIFILLTRMEALLLLIVWFFSMVHKVFVVKSDSKASLILQTGIFFVVVLSLYGFQYSYYGSFLSDALQFKRIATYYQPTPYQLFYVWGGTSLIITLLAFYSLFLPKPKSLWSLYAYIFLSFASFLTGPYSDGARYTVHILPILIIFTSFAINNIIVNAGNKKIFKGVVVLLLLIALQTFLSAFVTRSYMIARRQEQLCRKEIGRLINYTLTDSDYVLSGDIGMIAYQAIKVRFIDLGGLTSKDVLEHYQRKRNIDDIILYKKPKLLADSFDSNREGKLIHPLLMNQSDHIVGMRTYSNQFSQTMFQNVVYQCSDGKHVFAIVDLKSLYK